MGLFDIIVILVVLFMAYLGYKDGIICQLGKIGALIIALFVVNLFGTDLSNLICSAFDIDEAKSMLIGDLSLFVIIFILISVFAKGLKLIVHKIHLGWIDSTAGTLFAIFKTLVILSIAAWIAAVFAEDEEIVQKISNTPSFNFLIDFIPSIFHLIK